MVAVKGREPGTAINNQNQLGNPLDLTIKKIHIIWKKCCYYIIFLQNQSQFMLSGYMGLGHSLASYFPCNAGLVNRYSSTLSIRVWYITGWTLRFNDISPGYVQNEVDVNLPNKPHYLPK